MAYLSQEATNASLLMTTMATTKPVAGHGIYASPLPLLFLAAFMVVVILIAHIMAPEVQPGYENPNFGDGTLVGYELEMYGTVDPFEENPMQDLAPGNPEILPRSYDV